MFDMRVLASTCGLALSLQLCEQRDTAQPGKCHAALSPRKILWDTLCACARPLCFSGHLPRVRLGRATLEL